MFALKGIAEEMKRQITGRERILAIQLSEMALSIFAKLHCKTTQNPMRITGKHFNRHFNKEIERWQINI